MPSKQRRPTSPLRAGEAACGQPTRLRSAWEARLLGFVGRFLLGPIRDLRGTEHGVLRPQNGQKRKRSIQSHARYDQPRESSRASGDGPAPPGGSPGGAGSRLRGRRKSAGQLCRQGAGGEVGRAVWTGVQRPAWAARPLDVANRDGGRRQAPAAAAGDGRQAPTAMWTVRPPGGTCLPWITAGPTSIPRSAMSSAHRRSACARRSGSSGCLRRGAVT